MTTIPIDKNFDPTDENIAEVTGDTLYILDLINIKLKNLASNLLLQQV